MDGSLNLRTGVKVERYGSPLRSTLFRLTFTPVIAMMVRLLSLPVSVEPVRPFPGGDNMAALFSLGTVSISDRIKREIAENEVESALERHASGDWGWMHDDGWAENDQSLAEGDELLSAYVTQARQYFWVITNPERTATRVIFPIEL